MLHSSRAAIPCLAKPRTRIRLGPARRAARSGGEAAAIASRDESARGGYRHRRQHPPSRRIFAALPASSRRLDRLPMQGRHHRRCQDRKACAAWLGRWRAAWPDLELFMAALDPQRASALDWACAAAALARYRPRQACAETRVSSLIAGPATASSRRMARSARRWYARPKPCAMPASLRHRGGLSTTPHLQRRGISRITPSALIGADGVGANLWHATAID